MLESLDRISAALVGTIWITAILIPAVLCLLLAAAFRKREELSRLAVRNASASVVIWGLNVAVMTLCWPELSAGVQALYEGVGLPTLPEDAWDGVPVVVAMVVAVAARDFADYWNHRAMHTRWLWPTHAAHHSDTHVNAFTASRIHVLEAFVMMASYVLLLTWMQLPELIPFVLLVNVVHTMYVHMDLPWTHGPLRLLIASPVFHRWHHADTPEAYGKNLANVMPLWDWLFGTYDPPREMDGVRMGAVDSGVPDTDPVAIYVLPFRQWAAMIRRRVRRVRRWVQDGRSVGPAADGLGRQSR